MAKVPVDLEALSRGEEWRKRIGAWGGVDKSEGLRQLGFSPCPHPQLPQPHQTWPHCQAHFRDGWKFPFQQNPFVKPWSFEPRAAFPAWFWPTQPVPLPTPDLRLLSRPSRQGSGSEPGLPQTPLQPHRYSLQRSPLMLSILTSWDAPKVSDVGDWSLPSP